MAKRKVNKKTQRRGKMRKPIKHGHIYFNRKKNTLKIYLSKYIPSKYSINLFSQEIRLSIAQADALHFDLEHVLMLIRDEEKAGFNKRRGI